MLPRDPERMAAAADPSSPATFQDVWEDERAFVWRMKRDEKSLSFVFHVDVH